MTTMRSLHAAWRPALPLAAVVAAAACSRAQPPAPAPAPTPEPVVAAPVVRPPMAPAQAAGTYVLQAVIQGRTIPAPAPATPQARGRTRAAAAPAASLQLVARAPAALEPAAPSTRQFVATVALPGYTMSPRGRLAQAATWWPTGGDSLVVFFTQPQRAAAISLRGVLRGDTLSGDVWYTSTSSGAEFQLGTFTAARRRTRR